MKNPFKNKWTFLTLLILSVLVVLALSAFVEMESWTGDPDPYACNQFHDCFWTTTVCIDGETYLVGIYEDLVGADDALLEEMAMYWTETELTAGACPVAKRAYFKMWLLTGRYVNRKEPGVGYAGDACMLISESIPSAERQMKKCFPINDPEWVADNAPCAGMVFEDGSWECEAAMKAFNPDLEIAVLFYEDGSPGPLWYEWQSHLNHNEGIWLATEPSEQ